MRQDFYVVLGISPVASADEIRQAYRQLARRWHPDANPGDPKAAEYFKIVNEAYRILGTPELRAAYDDALRRMSPSSAADFAQNSQGRIPAAGVPPSRQEPSRVSVSRNASPASHAPAASEPALGMRITAAQTSIVPPREPTRFYIMAELGPLRDAAVMDPLPLDLALVIDRSSSMRGEKITNVRMAIRAVLDQLRAQDLMTLVPFDDRAEVLVDGLGVDGRAGIESALNQLSVRGNTAIASGLKAALERLATRPARERVATLVLLSDGRTYNDEKECLQLASQARDMGISIAAMGLGLDWNRELLDNIAAISGGSSTFVEQPDDLSTQFLDVVQRLRATLASSMRLTLEPAPGVRVARATRVSPEIAEAFSIPTGALTAAASAFEPVSVEMGSLVGRPDIEAAVLLWEVVLDPATLASRSNVFDLGRIVARYWAPRLGGGEWQSLEQVLSLPVNMSGQHAPIQKEVRLALELITAYRLHTQADTLKANGQAEEAAKRMNTAALRLRSAGSNELADQAESAARLLADGAGKQAITETLRVKYGTKNMGVFHRLRQHLLSS